MRERTAMLLRRIAEWLAPIGAPPSAYVQQIETWQRELNAELDADLTAEFDRAYCGLPRRDTEIANCERVTGFKYPVPVYASPGWSNPSGDNMTWLRDPPSLYRVK